MGVVCKGEGDAGLLRQADQAPGGALFLGDAVVLNFEEKVLRPEKLPQLERLGLRALVIVTDQHLGDGPGETAGEADKALGMLMQQRPVDAGLDIEALGKGGRNHIAEVAVARLVAAQKDQMGILVIHAVDPVSAAVGGHIDLAADDGPDSCGLTGLIKGDGPIHDAVVREGDGRLSQLLCARGEPVRAAGAVEQTVLAVNM